jgi:hypothetical protein
MRKKARRARLVRDVAAILVPVLQVIKLIVEIANKVANCCHARKLQIQISDAREVYLRT